MAEGAQIIIGPLFANEAAAVGPLARERGVKVLSFSTDRSVAGSGVFLLGFTPDQQVERVIGFARTRGMTRFALLAPDSAYGNAVAQATDLATRQTGGQLLRQDRYPGDTADLTPVVRRFATGLRALPPRSTEESAPAETADSHLARPVDAVLLPEGGARLRALAPLLPYFDIDPRTVRFLGTGLWEDAGLGSEPALVGGWYAAPAPEGFAEFSRRFEQAFGRRPVRLASLAYDTTALVGILARREDPAPFSDAALTNPDGFAGYDGIFRFLPDGLVQRGLAVLEVQRRGSRVIDPAPASFQQPAN
jgi:branched-chain amino acid transport system substrate-binding protein